MRVVSKAVREQSRYRADFYATATITLSDGTVLDIGKDDLYDGNTLVESAEMSSLPYGCVIPKSITLLLVNDDDRYMQYSFINAKISLWSNYDLEDETTEKTFLGIFTVITPNAYGSVIEISAMDDSYKLDKPYDSEIGFPSTALSVYLDICEKCGLNVETASFRNSTYMIDEYPGSVTYRQMLGSICALAGGNGIFTAYNYFKIVPYYKDIALSANGGTFDDGEPLYDTGDSYDGGSFNPWTDGANVDSGSSWQQHIITNSDVAMNMSLDVDDCIITGVELTSSETTYRASGSTDGYVLQISSPIAAGKEQQFVNIVGQMLIGLSFRPFSSDVVPMPWVEAMDTVFVSDKKNGYIYSIITDVTYAFSGFTTIKCTADSVIRSGSSWINNFSSIRNEVEKRVNEYNDQAFSLVSNGFGLHFTKREAPNGGVIVYAHDAATLEASTNIFKVEAGSFTVSSDGGETWKEGFDTNGNAVLNILSVKGFLFDWARGGTLYLGGLNNQRGRLYVLAENSSVGALVDNTGMTVYKRDENTDPSYLDNTDQRGAARFGEGSLSFYTYIGSSGNTNTYRRCVTTRRIEHESIELYDQPSDRIGYGFFADDIMMGVGKSMLAFGYYANIPGLYNKYKPIMTIGQKLASHLSLWANRGSSASSLQFTNFDLLVSGNTVFREMTAFTDYVLFDSSVYLNSDLVVQGKGYKNKVVETDDYDTVRLSSYETATPMYGDVGTGEIDENGVCVVFIDDVLLETIAGMEYYVFLQKEGRGDLWIKEKHSNYFVVEGTSNLKFSWELKAVQKYFEMSRLDKFDPEKEEKPFDYEAQYSREYEELFKELEGIE